MLATQTVANRLRLEGKRAPLKRIRSTPCELPRDARANLLSTDENIDENEKQTELQFLVTDRSGIPVVVIKNWAKDGKLHTSYSQRSTALQHAEDLVLFVVRATRNNAQDEYKPLQQKLRQQNQATSYIIIESDGAAEHNATYLQNMLPYWEVLRVLNLNGIEKMHFCPRHLRDNPDEMLNCTVKHQFRGHTLGEITSDEQAYHSTSQILPPLLLV